MRIMNRLLLAMEGVSLAMESMRANKVRALLTIMGVAVGVFVVVALSSVVRGINESFARDVEAAGPTSFFLYRRNIGGFQACDGTDETCPERRNPPITIDEANAIERLPSILAVTSHVANGGTFKYKDRELNAGMEAYTPNWTDVDGGDIYPGRSFTYAENANAAQVVVINDKMAEQLYGDSDPIDKDLTINGVPFKVIGLYHYTASPMGTPTSAGGGDSPKAILPWETARRHLSAGDIASRSQEITKAQEIILELASSVNPTKAPELSERLLALYDYMQAQLIEANMEQKDEPLATVDSLLRTLQEAWSQVEESKLAHAS